MASSSRHGNAYLIEVPGQARVLVDCGLPLRRLEAVLARIGVDPATLDAIFLSHEHGDHIHALRPKGSFPQRHRVPVYAPSRLWRALSGRIGLLDPGLRRDMEPWTEVALGDGRLRVTAFPKSHDAADPVSFLLTTPSERIGVVTDLGRAEPAADAPLFGLLRGAEHLIFESNHDMAMELASARPAELKARVMGARGHLSNDQAGRALARLVSPATRTVVLAHLSLDCNTPALALSTVASHLRGTAFVGRLEAAPPDRPGSWLGAAREAPAPALV